MKKSEREEREYKSLYSDERYAKKAWKALMGKSLESSAAQLPDLVDKQGNPTNESIIYQTAYNQVVARLKSEGKDRAPQKAEVLIEASIIRASFDTSVFNVILDRTAGKVKEEINIGIGAFEELTDEELEVLANHRQRQLESGGTK